MKEYLLMKDNDNNFYISIANQNYHINNIFLFKRYKYICIFYEIQLMIRYLDLNLNYIFNYLL